MPLSECVIQNLQLPECEVDNAFRRASARIFTALEVRFLSLLHCHCYVAVFESSAEAYESRFVDFCKTCTYR